MGREEFYRSSSRLIPRNVTTNILEIFCFYTVTKGKTIARKENVKRNCINKIGNLWIRYLRLSVITIASVLPKTIFLDPKLRNYIFLNYFFFSECNFPNQFFRNELSYYVMIDLEFRLRHWPKSLMITSFPWFILAYTTRNKKEEKSKSRQTTKKAIDEIQETNKDYHFR